jgi:hypothetical protein
VRERRKPVNVGNQPHRDNGEGLASGLPLTHCVSRMDVLLSRNINGAVDVGNIDLILPLRVRARRENVVKTPGFGSGERSQGVPAMGRREEAGQRCSEGERFGLMDVRASALTAKPVSQPPLRFTGRARRLPFPVILWVMRAVTGRQRQNIQTGEVPRRLCPSSRQGKLNP